MISINGENFIGVWKESDNEFSIPSNVGKRHPIFETKWGKNAIYITTVGDGGGDYETFYDVYRVQKSYTIKLGGL